jgi:zinc resistance-associated protein
MKRWIIGAALTGLVLATGALAHGSGDMMRSGRMGHPGMGKMGQFSPEDLEAFTDARIAALHAGLKLSPDQDKLWPLIEEAIRTLVRQRRDQRRAWRDRQGQVGDDLPGTLRAMADRQAARADALRKLADAAAPLYGTLDEGQKRRLHVLMRFMRPHRGMMAAHMYGLRPEGTQP